MLYIRFFVLLLRPGTYRIDLNSMKRFFQSFSYLLAVHVTGLFFLTLFRLLFWMDVRPQVPDELRSDIGMVLTAFVRGVWFDNVIACYVLIVPLGVCGIAALFGYYGKWLFRSCHYYFVAFYALLFLSAAANIPYYLYFTKVLNSSIFNWFEYGTTTASMVVGESSYYKYIAYFLVATVLFSVLTGRYTRVIRLHLVSPRPVSWPQRGGILLATACLVGLCLFGIRGRIGYNPIKVSAAYFCLNPVLNQMGINPTFNLMASVVDDNRSENKVLHLMPADEAVRNAQSYLHRTGIDGISPLARVAEADTVPSRKNVVMVMMESMSASLMQQFGQEARLTPYLDSLYHESLSFANFYSAGNHTNHGLYATLYSFPSVMKRNAMKGSVIPTYSGLPTVLRDNGYATMFFMTHESQYDNMNAFFRTNGYQEIYSQENYPNNKVVNGFGVQDDFLFSYALPVLNRHAATGKPFFATLLTISNHPPYIIPPHFHPETDVPEHQIVEYADWSIRCFMEAASREPWFDNTIFVFLGDHGKMVGTADCELPQSYNHIPFIIYETGITPEERTDFAGQVDVAPTLLGMLGISYTQNNFGIDLLKEQRPAMFYTADNTVAARDSAHLYVYDPTVQREFCYDTSDGTPHPTVMSEPYSRLKSYCFSMLQATEWMVQQGMTLDHPKSK